MPAIFRQKRYVTSTEHVARLSIFKAATVDCMSSMKDPGTKPWFTRPRHNHKHKLTLVKTRTTLH